MVLASCVGYRASCNHNKTDLKDWMEEFRAELYKMPLERDDETHVTWPAACSKDTHYLHKTVQSVMKGAGGFERQLMCKLCEPSGDTTQAEKDLARAVAQRMSWLNVVSQAILAHQSAVDVWWPSCATVAEVDGRCHKYPHMSCRARMARTGKSKEQLDAEKQEALEKAGYRVFRIKNEHVHSRDVLDALEQHLRNATLN